MRYEYCEFANLKYITRYPRGYKEGEKYPVLIFLHGAGTRGDDLDMVKTNCFFSITDEIENFPFITIAPQCSAKTWFDVFERLKRVVSHVCNEAYTDKKRVYVMGSSLGGYGTWQLSISMAEVIAAAVPICGGGVAAMVGDMINVPVWAFHGELDKCVMLEEAKIMVNALNECGGNAKLTALEGVGHSAWDYVYGNAAVYEWLLSHENTNALTIPDVYNDMTLYG